MWRILLAAGLVLGGCGGKSEKKSEEKKAPEVEAKEESKRLYTGAGETTIRETEGERHILYVIRWRETQLEYTLEGGPSTGQLRDVTGELYQDGKRVSTFRGASAVADKEKHLLVVTGSVVVDGTDPKAKLECERLEWNTKTKQLKAKGKVKITFQEGVIGPTDELWCLPDLQRAGTPGFSP